MDHVAPCWGASALVVIDMQADFAGIGGTVEVAPRVDELAAAFRRAGRPVVHIVRLYPPGSSDIDLPRRGATTLVAPGTPGAGLLAGPAGTVELDADLLLDGRPQEIGDGEIVLFKPRWGAFYRTDLERWLRERGVDTVVVCGCNLPNCPRATLFEASERDFRTVLAEDAVSQTSPERLADLAGIGVTLSSTAEIIGSLSAA